MVFVRVVNALIERLLRHGTILRALGIVFHPRFVNGWIAGEFLFAHCIISFFAVMLLFIIITAICVFVNYFNTFINYINTCLS